MKAIHRFILCLAVVSLAVPSYAVDLSITPASVTTTSTSFKDITAGATITAGQAIYQDSTDNEKGKLADANDTSAKAVVVGIALHGAASGQPLRIQTGGNITIGATVTVGKVYVLSETAGGIKPIDDIDMSDYVTVIGVGTTSAIIKMNITVSGVQVP